MTALALYLLALLMSLVHGFQSFFSIPLLEHCVVCIAMFLQWLANKMVMHYISQNLPLLFHV